MLRALVMAGGLVLAWQALVLLADPPPYILPGPLRVLAALIERFGFLAHHAAITLVEIVIGLIVGTLLGVGFALTLSASLAARRWLMPLLVASQAIPVFALAPLLVLWFGYGMASKIAMASLIIFFPVASAFLDGLRRLDRGYLDLARVIDARPLAMMMRVRVPAALPALASGMRVGAAIAPIGAVIGEWVGASGGLGFVMLQANARMQIDVMFAALLVLAAIAVTLYVVIDRAARALIPWQYVSERVSG